MSTLTGIRTHSTSHSPPSLPSFAQTFSNINNHASASSSASVSNLAKISLDGDQGNTMHTLPPIHHIHRDTPDRDAEIPPKTKKRTREPDDHDIREPEKSSEAVKRESVSPSPSASQMELDQLDSTPSPPNPAARRPAKKRRVNSAPGSKPQPSGDHDRDRDSPVSPMVVGFELPSSDQGALDQVRATFSIKQKQKEMIDQRRGSAAGLLQTTPSTPTPPRPGPPPRRQSATSTGSAPAASSSQPHPSPQQQHAQPQSQPPTHRFSPPQHALPAPNNSFSNSRRRRGTLQQSEASHSHPVPQHPRLPTPILTASSSSSSQAFPQPPPPQRSSVYAKSTAIRAGPPKPLTIAPLAHSRRLEPLVHSAPVIGRSGFAPMRVPELPPIPITPGGRRISSVGSGAASVAIARSGGMRTAGLGLGLGRVATGSSGVGAVPPTPPYASLASQQQQQHQQQQAPAQEGKAGFLKLFENFYDSLADSRLLKQWLQEQLTKSNALLEQLEAKGNGGGRGGMTLPQVEELLERKIAPMRNEVEGLRRRVGELEEMLYRERQRGGAPRRESAAANHELEDRDDAKSVSVSVRGSKVSDPGGYVFPERRLSDESGERDKMSPHASPSFDQGRLSTSAVRLESGPAHAHAHAHHVHPSFPLPGSSGQHRPSPLGLERERERERERDVGRSWERRRPGSASQTNGDRGARVTSTTQEHT